VTTGERDLRRILADLKPILSDERYAFEKSDNAVFDTDIFALVREEEGVSAIRVRPTGEWARLSLGVHSSLEAVGLTAALSNALAAAGISANVIAGLNHDHIFVPWELRKDALRVIDGLA
jgi:uncharacterized protein